MIPSMTVILSKNFDSKEITVIRKITTRMPSYVQQKVDLFVPCDNPKLNPKGFKLVKKPLGLFWHKTVYR